MIIIKKTDKKEKERTIKVAERKKNSPSGQRGRKKAPENDKKSRKAAAAVPPQDDPVNQFWSVILFALGVLIFLLSIVEGSSGWKMIHNTIRGLFGVSVFMVPVILIYTAVLIGMQRSQRTVYARAMWGAGLILVSSSVVQVIFSGMPQGNTFGEKCSYLYETGMELEGGGMLSALIAWPLMNFFGVLGAQIIVCILMFITIMILSNLTLVQLFHYLTLPFRKAYASLKEIREENRTIKAYEEWEYDEEQEAINLANSEPLPADTVPDDDYDINMRIPDNDDIDIMLPDLGQPQRSGNKDIDDIDIPLGGDTPAAMPETTLHFSKTGAKAFGRIFSA